MSHKDNAIDNGLKEDQIKSILKGYTGDDSMWSRRATKLKTRKR